MPVFTCGESPAPVRSGLLRRLHPNTDAAIGKLPTEPLQVRPPPAVTDDLRNTGRAALLRNTSHVGAQSVHVPRRAASPVPRPVCRRSPSPAASSSHPSGSCRLDSSPYTDRSPTAPRSPDCDPDKQTQPSLLFWMDSSYSGLFQSSSGETSDRHIVQLRSDLIQWCQSKSKQRQC